MTSMQAARRGGHPKDLPARGSLSWLGDHLWQGLQLDARGKKSCWCEAQTSGLVAGVRTASQWDCNGGEPRRLSYWALRLRETHAAKQATVAAENK